MMSSFGYDRGQGAGREVPTSGGGPFIAVHLRRRDYLVAHGDVVPSLEGVARQVNRLRSLLNIRHVFLATDAPRSGDHGGGAYVSGDRGGGASISGDFRGGACVSGDHGGGHAYQVTMGRGMHIR